MSTNMTTTSAGDFYYNSSNCIQWWPPYVPQTTITYYPSPDPRVEELEKQVAELRGSVDLLTKLLTAMCVAATPKRKRNG